MPTIEQLMRELVAVKSDTGTALENQARHQILRYLSEFAYFKAHPDRLGEVPLQDDPMDRAVVYALLKGRSPDCVVLLHHHDVVDAEDYGVLKEVAYDPDALRQALSKKKLTADAMKDLKDERWLFGRGTADMKAGAAIQMKTLERFAGEEEAEGSLLLLSVPDEENLSAGMRRAAPFLRELAKKHGLTYRVAVDSEPHTREKSDHFVIEDGSVGKTMVNVYVRGKKAHIGESPTGFNPTAVLARIVVATEMNAELADRAHGEVAPPPTWSFARDFKSMYDASMPESAGGYLSFLSLSKTPDELIRSLKAIAEKAFAESTSYLEEQLSRLGFAPSGIQPRVMTFSELIDVAKKDLGGAFQSTYEKLLAELDERLNAGDLVMAEANFFLIDGLIDAMSDADPIVVLAFTPPYYPPVSVADLDTDFDALYRNLRVYLQEEVGLDLQTRRYFMGISDMSYLSFRGKEEAAKALADNMPLYGERYLVPFEDMAALSLPTLNLGPWGKDLHKLTERVYLPDVETVVPAMLDRLIRLYWSKPSTEQGESS